MIEVGCRNLVIIWHEIAFHFRSMNIYALIQKGDQMWAIFCRVMKAKDAKVKNYQTNNQAFYQKTENGTGTL